jgi:hypothetical protein
MTSPALCAVLAALDSIQRRMANVYIEPKPTGRDEGDAIDHYVIEHPGGAQEGGSYKTQHEAIEAARKAGHHPLVARVRCTDKGKPDHWRSA